MGPGVASQSGRREGPPLSADRAASQEHVASTESNRRFARFPLCYWRSRYSGIARVNIESMVKPLCGPYNNLHYGAVAIMLQSEELAKVRAVRCKR